MWNFKSFESQFLDWVRVLWIILFIFQDHPEDTETINKAVKLLRSKSESGYRGLVRVLQKFGKINVLLGTNGQTTIEESTTKPIKGH